jgi:hypothetical protein
LKAHDVYSLFAVIGALLAAVDVNALPADTRPYVLVGSTVLVAFAKALQHLGDKQ